MKYKVNEIFDSIQGEGFNTFKKVNFIRLSGCNLNCPFCDTKHEIGEEMEIGEIVRELNIKVRSVIITGGEPLTRNLIPLVKKLKELNYWIGIETNGTIDISDELRSNIDYISMSPKRGYGINLKMVDEVRALSEYTVDELEIIRRRIIAKHYFVSPIETQGKYDKRVLKLVDNTWKLSLQVHKIFDIK